MTEQNPSPALSRRMEEFYRFYREQEKAFCKCPVYEICGIVSRDASGFKHVANDDHIRTLHFDVASWKHKEGKIQHKDLCLMKPVETEEFERMKSILRVNFRFRATVRMKEDGEMLMPSNQPCANGYLVEFLGEVTDDPELDREKERLQEPVTFVDRQLGTFTLNRPNKTFDANLKWGGHSVKLCLNSEKGSSDYSAALHIAQQLWKDEEKWNIALGDILETLNENENRIGKEPMTRKEILEQVIPYEISIASNDLFWILLNDNNRFSNYPIDVIGTLEQGLVFLNVYD